MKQEQHGVLQVFHCSLQQKESSLDLSSCIFGADPHVLCLFPVIQLLKSHILCQQVLQMWIGADFISLLVYLSVTSMNGRAAKGLTCLFS